MFCIRYGLYIEFEEHGEQNRRLCSRRVRLKAGLDNKQCRERSRAAYL